jgi:hypothetical protein
MYAVNPAIDPAAIDREGQPRRSLKPSPCEIFQTLPPIPPIPPIRKGGSLLNIWEAALLDFEAGSFRRRVKIVARDHAGGQGQSCGARAVDGNLVQCERVVHQYGNPANTHGESRRKSNREAMCAQHADVENSDQHCNGGQHDRSNI